MIRQQVAIFHRGRFVISVRGASNGAESWQKMFRQIAVRRNLPVNTSLVIDLNQGPFEWPDPVDVVTKVADEIERYSSIRADETSY